MLAYVKVALSFILSLFVAHSTPADIRDRIDRPVVLRVQAAEHRLSISGVWGVAHCSAEAVGPHELLTASHCFELTETWVVDYKPAKVLNYHHDNHDHVILTVDRTFQDYLPMRKRFLIPGEPVLAVGEPGQWNAVLRFGTVVKQSQKEGPDEIKRAITSFDLAGAPGDSGAAVVDRNGFIIGVIAGGDDEGRTFGFDLAF